MKNVIWTPRSEWSPFSFPEDQGERSLGASRWLGPWDDSRQVSARNPSVHASVDPTLANPSLQVGVFPSKSDNSKTFHPELDPPLLSWGGLIWRQHEGLAITQTPRV